MNIVLDKKALTLSAIVGILGFAPHGLGVLAVLFCPYASRLVKGFFTFHSINHGDFRND